MGAFQLQLRDRWAVDFGVTQGGTTLNRSRRTLLKKIREELSEALIGGGGDSEYVFNYSNVDPTAANTGLAISSGSGTVGATLNGVATTVTWATSDTNTAALIAAAINASSTAKVQGMFLASNLTATITCVSVTAGMTVDVCGSRLVAVTGTPAAIYSGAGFPTFDRSGTDAQTATALASAINGFPGLSRWVFAVPVSNAVRLFARKFSYSAPTFSWVSSARVPANNLWSSSATALAVSSATLAAGAFVGICAAMEGAIGNCMSIAASGTGVSVLNSETYLMRGASFDTAPVSDYA